MSTIRSRQRPAKSNPHEANGLRRAESLTLGLAHLSHPPVQVVPFQPRFDGRDVVAVAVVFEDLRKLSILLTEPLQHGDSLSSRFVTRQELDNSQRSVWSGNWVEREVSASDRLAELTSHQELLAAQSQSVNDLIPAAAEVEMVLIQCREPWLRSGPLDFKVSTCSNDNTVG